MNFLMNIWNHDPTGRRTLDDVLTIIVHQIVLAAEVIINRRLGYSSFTGYIINADFISTEP